MKKISTIVLFEKDLEKLYATLHSLTDSKNLTVEIIVSMDEMLFNYQEKITNDFSQFDIRTILTKSGINCSQKFNAGASIASCEYFSFYMEGTIVNIKNLYALLPLIDTNKNPTWSYGLSVNNEDNEISKPPQNWPSHRREGLIFPYNFVDHQIDYQSLLVPKKIFDSLNQFNIEYSVLFGEELVLRLALFYKPLYYNQPIVITDYKKDTSQQFIYEQLLLLYEFMEPTETMGLKQQFLNSVLLNISKYNLWNSLGDFLQVLSKDPTCNELIEKYLAKTFVEQEITPSLNQNVTGVLDCVGCGSCSHRCPCNAITIDYNDEGFLYPTVDTNSCINCGQCLEYCPTQNKLDSTPCQDKCLAIMADDNYREKSSSGGIFPLIGEFFINSGGYVSGAVFEDGLNQGHVHVKHIISNSLEDLNKMRSSKYVQSDTSEVYPIIEQLLLSGSNVFFTGCVCQIAGLKAFLKKDYPNLYTADVVCHGSPSPGVFNNYINELFTKHGSIDEINFRKKSEFGWQTGLYVKYKNGDVLSNKLENIYLTGFLKNWFLRKTCYDCQFKSRKYSDITLGDFWGIETYDKKLNDNKGTSFVEINTRKGVALYQTLLSNVENKLFMPTEYSIKYNPCIRESVPKNKFREYFFNSWKKHKLSLAKTLDHTADNVHFDVAMVLMWSINHGNAITNYALYTILQRYCSVVVIDNCSTLHPSERFRDFADNYYQCTSTYFPDDRLDLIMDHCDTLLTGSDQIWNHSFESLFGYGTYYHLDFAKDRNNIKKIAYSSSFGDYSQVPNHPKYKELFEQFDKISVRDIFGPEAFHEKFNLEAEFVLDPVFLIDEEDYDKLIDKASPSIVENEPFIVSYVLNPTKEKRAACKQIQEALGGIKIINICEGTGGNDEYSKYILEFDNIKLNVTVEDWLYYFKNAAFVITDSFHGTCFSVYFKKQFMSFVNRQSGRFLWFKELGEPYQHIVETITNENIKACLSPIDYNKVWNLLNAERKRSLSWLETALGVNN